MRKRFFSSEILPLHTSAAPVLILFAALLLSLSLSACGAKKGKLDEGDCPGTVSFTDIPKVFSRMDEDFLDSFYIKVRLKDVTTDKEYDILLNKKNDFKQELSLHPGTYRFVSANAHSDVNLKILVNASEETITFAEGQNPSASVIVTNEEELNSSWGDIQPNPDILLADKFSGLIQINRKVIPIQNILSEISSDAIPDNKTVAALQKATVIDREKGLEVLLINPTDSPLPLAGCKVIGVIASANTVVFPDGVTIGAAPQEVCHRTTGLYGQPDRFKSTLLYSWGVDNCDAIYSDPVTGNRITIKVNPTGSAISQIIYELAVFE